jgi:hypothetical protein
MVTELSAMLVPKITWHHGGTMVGRDFWIFHMENRTVHQPMGEIMRDQPSNASLVPFVGTEFRSFQVITGEGMKCNLP